MKQILALLDSLRRWLLARSSGKLGWVAAGLALLLLIGFILVRSLFSSIEAEIAKTWPKEDLASVQRLISVETSERLGQIGQGPTLLAHLRKDELIDQIQANLKEVQFLKDTKVDFRTGYILANSKLELRSERSASSDAPSYVVTAGVSFALAPYVDDQNRVRFRVVLTRVQDVEANGEDANKVPEPVRRYLAGLISSRLSQINGVFNGECGKPAGQQIVKVPPCVLAIPTLVPVDIHVTKPLADQPQTQTVEGAPVILPIKLDRALVFVSDQGLSVMALAHLLDDPAFVPSPPPPQGKSLPLTELAKEIDARLRARLGENYAKQPVVAGVDVSLIASAFGSIAQKSDLHLIQSFSTTPEPFNTEVRLAKKPTFSCSRDSCSRQSCRPAQCYSSEGKECGVGGVIGEAVCKIVKNTTCEAANAAGGLVCNTVQEVGVGSCNVFEELKKGGCEANKVFVDKALGRVGALTGDYAVSGTYDIRVISASASRDLTRLRLSAVSGAEARARGSLRFVPMDHGHILVCVSQWKEPFDVGVSLPLVQRDLSATLQNAAEVENGLELRYGVDKFKLEGQVSPSPFDAVFTQHPHLRINCSLAAAIGDLAKLVNIVDPANEIVPDELNQAVTGRVSKDVEDARFAVHVPDLPLRFGEHERRMKPQLQSGYLVFSPR